MLVHEAREAAHVLGLQAQYDVPAFSAPSRRTSRPGKDAPVTACRRAALRHGGRTRRLRPGQPAGRRRQAGSHRETEASSGLGGRVQDSTVTWSKRDHWSASWPLATTSPVSLLL
ncbi:hypothetical protein GUJ93_ZPchr0337g7095 [Zizania palustris]|uniref:Uncharacterized protein n=1 Tax=Zizania palustris TaxID=103762 RepID=A0A8J5R7P4_ZIZPA|nr:hypothetical protein GUJ93_ZPchr0337g7095 [Zizania palustris]